MIKMVKHYAIDWLYVNGYWYIVTGRASFGLWLHHSRCSFDTQLHITAWSHEPAGLADNDHASPTSRYQSIGSWINQLYTPRRRFLPHSRLLEQASGIPGLDVSIQLTQMMLLLHHQVTHRSSLALAVYSLLIMHHAPLLYLRSLRRRGACWDDILPSLLPGGMV